MKTTLRRDLLGVLFVGLVLAFALQMAIRVLSELPALYRLEEQSDRNAVQHVQADFSRRTHLLQRLALDYSVWDDTYDFMESTPESEEWNYYLQVALDFQWDSFLLHDVSGLIYLDSDDSLVYCRTFDRDTGEPGRDLDLTQPAVLETLTADSQKQSNTEPSRIWPDIPVGAYDPAILASGFLVTDQGPVIFASTEIHRTRFGAARFVIETNDVAGSPEERHKSRDSKSRGTLIFWRHFDETAWQGIEETMGIDLDFLPFHQASSRRDLDAIIATLLGSRDAIIPRENHGHIFWLLRDASGEPAMLVRQEVPPRGFDERWVTASVLVGFGASGLALLLIGIFFSKRVIGPIAHLRDIAMKIGEGKLQLRTSVSKGDEIGQLSQSINLMSANLLDAREHLEQLAFTDNLTGLNNRRMFIELVNMEINAAKRRTCGLALLFIDLDGFKGVNDSAGHEAGDYVLQQVAERLIKCLRAEDIIARSTQGETAIDMSYNASRFGGDEFTVLVANLEDASECGIVAERIRNAIKAPYYFEAVTHHISCCIGIATYPGTADTTAELVKQADSAMYTAKQSGKNRCCYYDPVISGQANEHLMIASALSCAIEEHRFHLLYQPIFSLKSKQMIGCEALLRWDFPSGQFVSPGVFIPIAEDAGLIRDIDFWVLDEACRQQQEWREQGIAPPPININVSARQLSQEGFRHQVEASLHRHGIGPETLAIEITETSMMQGTAEVTEELQSIGGMGVSISLDDFGTGYSSLGTLKTLPIDNVKIDKSFIDGITESPDGGAIVKGVIAMCKELGLSTTAEGVEVEEQLSFLREVGCDYAQGYLLSKPLPAKKMTAFIAKGLATPRPE